MLVDDQRGAGEVSQDINLVHVVSVLNFSPAFRLINCLQGGSAGDIVDSQVDLVLFVVEPEDRHATKKGFGSQSGLFKRNQRPEVQRVQPFADCFHRGLWLFIAN
ncbi:hypothetical protein OGATHE_003694 [Ogataea polymorpha]|uniref:Uncharacterized protein n=1 Tax=Ogataea polymorpha TaxID=460523 RepID=A0A9P8T447_9ASCO|nr:hypothetical protein OGATHE_003694 [Ogataea polymorpha]